MVLSDDFASTSFWIRQAEAFLRRHLSLLLCVGINFAAGWSWIWRYVKYKNCNIYLRNVTNHWNEKKGVGWNGENCEHFPWKPNHNVHENWKAKNLISKINPRALILYKYNNPFFSFLLYFFLCYSFGRWALSVSGKMCTTGTCK